MKKQQHLVKQVSNISQGLFIIPLLLFGSISNPVLAQNWNEIIKTVASDRGTDDQFGFSVAISGEYAIIGARHEDQDTSGGNTLGEAGSAYIFKNNAGTWLEVQKLVASDRGRGDWFGYSVAISGDFAIVGAFREDQDTSGGNALSRAGSAYIFKNNAGTWSEVQKIVASDRGFDDQFGFSVAISGDYALIGAKWEDEDTTGGNTLTRAGSAYIFKNNAGTWSEVQKIVASDRGASDNFGFSVAISGDVAIVGAFGEDQDTTGGNSLNNAGSAYIFKNNAGTWSEVQKIVASDRGASDRFGLSVGISGDNAIVGAYQEDQDTSGGNFLTDAGSAYLFKNNAGTWSEVQKLVASDRGTDDQFGWSVAISGEYAIIGARYEDQDTSGGSTLADAGSAYLFKNNAGTWSEAQKLVASDRGAGDQFGFSAAISGGVAIVGALLESEDTTGGNTLSNAGSAYIFSCITRARDVQTACDSLTWIDGITYTSNNNTATDTLTNAAGCDSIVTLDLTINFSTTNNDTVTACDRYTWNANNIIYTTSGTYMDTLTTTAGCDSVLTLELTIDSVSDLSTTTAGLTITANNANATYQWLDCGNNYAIIAGDTSQTFTATANGDYAVELTENACVDTSACVAIISVGLLEESVGNELFKIYPNPSNGILTVELLLPTAGRNLESNPSLFIYNQMAQVVREVRVKEGKNEINLNGLPKGVYFIRYGNSSKKIVLID
ncbi:MAG: T9SS type A sorting domain-containing protein [Vicingaceae bacterium]